MTTGTNPFMEEGLEISEAFLAKYNRPGPRYTSYPTAPVWQDNIGPGDLDLNRAVLKRAKCHRVLAPAMKQRVTATSPH